MQYPLNFYTQYNQFYICDKYSPRDTGSDSFWTKDAFDDKLAVENGILGFGTECYGPVKGELFLLDAGKEYIKLDEFDHIVEGGIEIKSGIIQVLGCPTSTIELEFKVTPGLYRVRTYSSNLESVDGDEGDDFYKIEIWPDTLMERRVLKRYARKSG